MLEPDGHGPAPVLPDHGAGAALAGAAASSRAASARPSSTCRIVLGLAIGGIPAVLVAAFIVKEMPLEMLRWLVVVVVTYAAISLLLDAHCANRLRRAKGDYWSRRLVD